MGAVWINPLKAKMPKKEQDAWVNLMTKHHPETDWAGAMAELNEKHNVKRVSGKGKED